MLNHLSPLPLPLSLPLSRHMLFIIHLKMSASFGLGHKVSNNPESLVAWRGVAYPKLTPNLPFYPTFLLPITLQFIFHLSGFLFFLSIYLYGKLPHSLSSTLPPVTRN
jgi:hypothetical protein